MEGFVLMGAMIQFLPELARGAGMELSDAQRQRVASFVGTMQRYARRDIDKSQCEDKHLFRVDELMATGRDCGLVVRVLANTSFDAQRFGLRANVHRFGQFFRDYALHCLSWDADLLRLFDRFIAPHSTFVEEASSGGSGPYLNGVFVCKKTG